jgi:hypothetical protein
MTIDVKQNPYFLIKMNLTDQLMQELIQGFSLNAIKEFDFGIIKIEILPPKVEEVAKDQLEKEVVNAN